MNSRRPARNGSAFTDLIERLNDKLRPYIGPPPLGPYDAIPARVAGACPLCHRSMSEHMIDRTAPRTMLHCP